LTERLGFGMVGLGEIAYTATGGQIDEADNAEMIVGMDPVEHVVRSYQERYEIPCSTNLDDVLGNPDVDAVVISTPHHLHVPLGIKAAQAGKHVIVEKPMATTLEDADALIEACKEAGVLCSSKEGGVRYHPAAVKAKELIEQGAIGEVMATQVFGASDKPESYWTGGYTGRVQTTWRKFRDEAGGGILIMNYVYDVYRLRYLTGLEVKRVFAEYGNYRTAGVEVEDFITVTMRYTNGALGTITAASCAPGAQKSGIRGTRATGNQIYGTEGQIVFDGGDLLVYSEHAVDDVKAGEWTVLSFPDELVRRMYVTYFERFADAVFNGGPVDIPGKEGRKDLEVLLAAYKAGETNQPVELPM
jgi:UDP-N-acetyl-2-amino-2-deoxyglucuronate dehydrogenase